MTYDSMFNVADQMDSAEFQRRATNAAFDANLALYQRMTNAIRDDQKPEYKMHKAQFIDDVAGQLLPW